jgi:hypothetical protein
MEPLVIGLFLAVVNQKIVDYLVAPVRNRYPDADLWWLIYVALATGAAIGWFANINMFIDYVPDPLAGRILTMVVIGGGASLIHDIFDGGGQG